MYEHIQLWSEFEGIAESKKQKIKCCDFTMSRFIALDINPFTSPCRSLSETQETAQFLSGLHFPEAILQSLTAKAKLASKTLGIINFTPYDCWLERACCMKCLVQLIVLVL